MARKRKTDAVAPDKHEKQTNSREDSMERKLSACSLDAFLPVSGLTPERARAFVLWAREMGPMTVPDWNLKLIEFYDRRVK